MPECKSSNQPIPTVTRVVVCPSCGKQVTLTRSGRIVPHVKA